MTMITDGTGNGYKVGVRSDNRLQVVSVTDTSFEASTGNGLAFNLNTEDINLAGSVVGDQGLLYIKNNEDRELFLVGWFIGVRNLDTTNRVGSDTSLFKLVTNPTGGTLVSEAVPGAIANRTLGSPREFKFDIYKAAGQGKTVTGGEAISVLYQYHNAGRTFGTVSLTLPRGASLAITVDTFGANMDLYTGFSGYLSQTYN